MAFTTQDLKANLRYFKWNEKFETEKPYEIVSTYSNDLGAFPPTNVNREDWDVRERLIKDVRGTESYYQLDTHGFTYRSTDSTFSAFYDKEKVGNEYLPRVVYPFLKANVDNADEIYISSWRASEVFQA
ncbi:hypothetical protein MMC17_008006 [Xylographa soralifera]|nr:hypothetical protein [Xylographa soralifera]